MLSFYLCMQEEVYSLQWKKREKASFADFKFSFSAMRLIVCYVFILLLKEEKGTGS